MVNCKYTFLCFGGKMKRVLLLFLTMIIILTFIACDKEAEWRNFLKELEAWTEDYVELLEKTKNDSTDTEALNELLKKLGEAIEWENRAEEIKKELEGTAAAKEFEAEFEKILAKLVVESILG